MENVRKYFVGSALRVCYEASYVGFSLQRDLQDRGYPCAVVAPTRRTGGRITVFAIRGWLDRTIAACTGSLKVNLSLLFRQLKNLGEIRAAYGVEVDALAVAPGYENAVKALTCFFFWKGASRI